VPGPSGAKAFEDGQDAAVISSRWWKVAWAATIDEPAGTAALTLRAALRTWFGDAL
jgi:hypothetical protein